MKTERMPAKEAKALAGRIMKRYRKSLGLMRCDACELSDDVVSGRETEKQLFGTLDRMVFDRRMAEIEPGIKKICDELEDCQKLTGEDMSIRLH